MSDLDKRIFGSLGLCSKAGKLIFGVPMVIEAMQKGKPVFLVLEAADTSDNTHKRITDKCEFYGVKKVRLDISGVELAASVGKSASLAAVAIAEEGFYTMISKYLD